MTSMNKASSQPRKTKPKEEDLGSPHRDDTQRVEETLREYQAILSAAEEVAKIGSWKWDLHTQKVTWSDGMFRLFGVEREGFDGDLDRVIAERIHAEDVAAVAKANRKVMEEAEPIPMSYRIVLPDGTQRTVWAQGKLLRDANGQPQALTGFVQDITERVHAEKKIIQMKRLYATLSQVNQMIVRVKEQKELYQTICDVSVKFGEFSVAWIGLLDDASGDVLPVAANGLDVKKWPLPIINIREGMYRNGVIADAVKTSRVETSDNVQTDERTKSLQGAVLKFGFRSLASIPFRLRDRTIGVLNLISAETGFFNAEEEVLLLEEMGLDISFALDNLENEKERKRAEAQVLSLSKFPEENPNPILRVSSEGILLYSNQGSLSLLAFWRCRIGSSTPGDVQDMVAQALRDGRSREMEVEVDDGRVFSLIFAPIVESAYVNVYGRDVTEREKAQKELQLANARFLRMVDSNIVGIVIAEADGKIVLANDYYLSLLNLTRQDFMDGKVDWRKFTPPEWLPADEKAILELRERGVCEPYEKEYVRADGTRVSVLIADALFAGPEEQIIAFILDITERRKAEQALHESESRYRNLVETSPDGIFINRENQIVFMNSRGLEMLGATTQEQVLGRSPFQIFHPDSHSIIEERIKLLLNERVPVPAVEEKLVRLDGTILSAEVTAAPVMVDGVLAIQVVLRDSTERKRAEEQVKQNERVLRLFVEHSPASIAMFDRNMRYIIASHRYFIDYRLNIQELTGRSHYDIFPEIPERWKEIHRRGLNGEIIKAEEDPFPRIDGTLDWVRWEIRPWYEETGNIGGIILFSEVITERKQVQDELHLLNLKLEQRVMERTLELSQANRAKDEFLANMSHELRTPLNAVLGLSETLLEQRRGPLNEKQVQSIELIASSGRHLLGLINDILEVSKIEAGKLQLHPTQVSVKELCESSLNFIKEIALKKLIHVEFNSEESLSTIYADPQRLKQILINLLTNAVKFTPERGSVYLDVYTNADEDRIMFSVLDTGIGIAGEDLKKLFIPFTQLDSSLARQYAGTGLGLALVQKLTDLQGGSVEVESEVGRGSRFTVILPFHRTPEGKDSQSMAGPLRVEVGPMPASGVDKQQVRVLLAEDNAINAQMILEYLEARNYEVVVAQDGEEVLQKASETLPDIILMDIQMPKMDGLEATRHLRSEPRFASTPIIALTALAMPGDRERCLEAGANEYLSKPVSLKKLVETIKNLTHQ